MSNTVTTTETNPPPIPGHADVLKPSLTRDRVTEALNQEPLSPDEVPTQASMMVLPGTIESPDWADDVDTEIDRAGGVQVESPKPMEYLPPIPRFGTLDSRLDSIEQHESKPPKVLMEDPDSVPLELQSQIQIYATNEYAYPLFRIRFDRY